MTFKGKLHYDYCVITFNEVDKDTGKDSTTYKGDSWESDLSDGVFAVKNDNVFRIYNMNGIKDITFGNNR